MIIWCVEFSQEVNYQFGAEVGKGGVTSITDDGDYVTIHMADESDWTVDWDSIQNWSD